MLPPSLHGLADNFDGSEDQSLVDAYRSIEDIASYKEQKPSGTLGRFGPSPKVASVYKFNNIG